MSGFLQRLASSVLDAQRAIHPVVGNIWSAGEVTEPDVREPLAAAEPFESSVPLPRRADAPAPAVTQPSTQQAAAPQIQPERSTPVSESAVHHDAQEPAIVEGVAFQPLVASPQHSEAIPPPPHPVTSPEHTGPLPPQPVTSPKHTAPRPPHRIEIARPLMPVPPIPVPAPAGARKAPALQPLSQRQAQPAASLPREPDSIEIHIGRIEVLAAAPRPAQPAAPRPTRKSLDLGEYLRGERRSR
jgi:hypothetical protein